MPPGKRVITSWLSSCTRRPWISILTTLRLCSIEVLRTISLVNLDWRSKITQRLFRLTLRMLIPIITRVSRWIDAVTSTKRSNVSQLQSKLNLGKPTFTTIGALPIASSATSMQQSLTTAGQLSLIRTISRLTTIGPSAGIRLITCLKQSRITCEQFNFNPTMCKPSITSVQ